ncbi:MAG TPA: sensor histidine kinase [Acidimicrobiales bacterium]|nr:sensor histidine kinase [Acidimicrobiales bacterium]
MATADEAGNDASGVWPNRSSQHRLGRVLPLALVAVGGQLSALLNPTDMAWFWMSAVALAAAATVFVLTSRRYSLCLTAACYVASVAALMMASGGVATSGLGTLFFLAVVGVAMYGERRDSAIIVALVVVFLTVVTLSTPQGAASTARRLLFLGAIAAVMSVSIHALRERLEASNRRTGQLLHQSEAMNDAARELALLRGPDSIAAVTTELAAQVVSLPGGTASDAWYVRVCDASSEVVAHFGGDGSLADAGVDADDDTPAVDVVTRTRRPVSREWTAVPGDTVRRGTWVPVCLDGAVHGVLKVVTGASDTPDGCIEQLTALGHLMEMALANWAAHQELKRQATSEERRRVARDLHDGLAHELAFIASKARGSGAPREMKELSGAADRALDEARRAITVLSLSTPQSLVAALTQTAEDLGARLGVPVLVDLDEHVEVDANAAEQLLRIVREGLTNAAVHADPHYVTVTMRELCDGHRLVIADDGRGFEPDNVDATRFGLVSMRERAASIGGSFSVDSAPGRGTRLEVTFR